MKFSQLATYFEKIDSTSSRLSITSLLGELFTHLESDEFATTMYLLQGRVAPLFEPLEFGMAEKMVAKSAILAMNLEKKYFDNEFKKFGDIGLTVENFKKQFTSFDARDLTITEVFNELFRLAHMQGAGSQDQKVNVLAHLIRQLDPLATRYVVRIPLGTMRLGFSDVTILDAFSWMIKKDKSLRPKIEAAYHVRPDLGYIGEQIKKHGIRGLSHVKPKVFTPILMMRAERLSSGEEIINKIQKCAVETKFDGFRLQVHIKDKKVRMYSRNLEDVTFMYPDLEKAVMHSVRAKEVIFEGEAIGYDSTKKAFLPFQQTVQRKRKHGIEEMVKEIPLKLFAFEVLYADGQSLLNMPFNIRRKHLTSLIHSNDNLDKNTVFVATEEIVDDPKVLEKLFDEAIGAGFEGVIAKKLDGVYKAGAREWNWIKFKRSYSAKIEDTLDLIVMGIDFGKGKRVGFGIGAFLVGVYDASKDVYLTVAKIGTGLTDEEWRTLKTKSEKLRSKIKSPRYIVNKLMDVDVWIRPSVVVEIRADEITRSPTHTAGLALRFPRLERFRDDKRADDTTTLQELKNMFGRQKNNA